MAKEMGNTNTSTIKEEDNIIEADKNNLLEDTSEHANEISQDNENLPRSLSNDVMEHVSNISSDITIELGKDGHDADDDVKEKIQTISIVEANDAYEKATWFDSNNRRSMLESEYSLEEDTHASDMDMENQMHPKVEEGDVKENGTGLASEDATKELGEVSMQEERCEDDVKEKTQMNIPTVEADVEEKSTRLISHNVEIKLENDSMEGDTNESDMNMEYQMHPKLEEEGVVEKAKTELGKVSMQEECRGDDVKEKSQMIPTVEAKDVEEKATILISHNVESKLENVSLEGNANESDINIENPMHPKPEEDIKENSTTEHGEVLVQEESRGDDVKEKTPMIPTDEVKDVEDKATSHNVKRMLENDSSEGDTNESDIPMENQMHPIDEAEDVEEKAIEMDSHPTRSSLENDLLKGKVDLEIAAWLSYDDKSSELEDEDKKDENMIIPFTNGMDVQGKTTTLAFDDDPLNLRNSLGSEDEEMIGVIQSEKYPYSESVEDENFESLPSSSFEGSEECVKQEDSCLRKTYNDNLNEDSSIKQDEEETSILTLNAVNTSNDSELQESPSIHHEEVVKFLSEDSLQGNESLLKDALPNADSHFQQIKHEVSEKDMEYQEKLCENNSDGRDGNEFVNNMIDTTEGSIDSNHEEIFKALNEENKFSRSESTNENPQDSKQDQCIMELKEYKPIMVNTNDTTVGSNGDCNGETHTILDSSVFGIANIDQVEEPKVNENGFLFDDYVSDSIKVSDESSSPPEEENSAVHEVEGSIVVEDTNEKLESSYVMIKNVEETNMLEQCNSDMITINQEESFSLEISSTLFHIYNYNHGNVETKSFVDTSMPKSDEEAIEKESETYSQQAEATSLVEELKTSIESTSNNAIFANGDYETRDSVTRLSTESNSDNPNITCQMQKSPSFNLNLQIDGRQEESDQIPLLNESANDNLSNKESLNLNNSMPHDEYDDIEEKIVTMERSYSEVSKSSFIGFLKDEEEARLLVMEQTQDNNAGSKMEVKEVPSSSTSPKGKDKRNFRSFFFTNCMCCATVPN